MSFKEINLLLDLKINTHKNTIDKLTEKYHEVKHMLDEKERFKFEIDISIYEGFHNELVEIKQRVNQV